MTVSQAAMNGLNALMSLGARAKPIAREADHFKAAMADASEQHIPPKPRPERNPASKAAEKDSVKGERSEKFSPEAKPSAKTSADAAQMDDQGDKSDVEPAQTAANTIAPLEQVGEASDEVQLQAFALPIGQTGPLVQSPLAIAEGGVIAGIEGDALMSEVHATDEYGLAWQLPQGLTSQLSQGQGFANHALDTGEIEVSTTTSGLVGLAGVLTPADLAPKQINVPNPSLVTTQQTAQATNTIATGGVPIGTEGVEVSDDALMLNLGSRSDAETDAKLATAMNSPDKTLLTPSQKVLTAALIQPQGDLLKTTQSTDQKGSALKAVSEVPTSVANSTALTNALLNGRSQPLTVPVTQPHWAQSAGERVLWMVSQKLQSAEIQLDPPELGPLQVKVSVQHDQVSITFVSHSAQVREALDQHALRLREMFEGQGLDLVDVDVSDQSFQQREEAEHEPSLSAQAQDVEEQNTEAQLLITEVSSQLIDAFA